MTRALLFAGLCLLVGCEDPIRQSSIDELGDESPGVPKGPLHRPGQPCLVCHGGEGPARSEFALAGTVYQRPSSRDPLYGARVHFIDSTGAQHAVTSNCSGNFYVGAANFRPIWPVWTKLDVGDLTAEMVSPSFREGSCGACHAKSGTPSSAAHVYLVDDGVPFSQEACK